MIQTPNLSLIAWNLSSDPYNSEELAENWIKVDLHDHTSGKGAAITTAAIADEAITSDKIHPDAFPDLTLADNAVTTAKINADAVTAPKIANDAVGSTEIAAGAVTNSELGSNAVDRAKTIKSFVQGKRATFSSETSKIITWDTAFADTSYTVALAPEGTGVAFAYISAKSTTTVTVATSFAWSGTMHVVGIHD